MTNRVHIIGAGLAGSECALYLAQHGIDVSLYEMRPEVMTPVHKTGLCAELVCSNSLKSTKEDSAAGMLKNELHVLNSNLLSIAYENAVPAGGALAVDRETFSLSVQKRILAASNIEYLVGEITSFEPFNNIGDVLVLATGPLTSDALGSEIESCLQNESLAFYDAAAPIVSAESLNDDIIFSQSRYEQGWGDYLNIPFSKEEYEYFIEQLISAQRVVSKDFETKELFQACQLIEEIARKGKDAPRFGCMKPVGLIDPRTGKRPWAAVQLRSENKDSTCFNLVGFQTNLTFPEQKRVFSLMPGLEQAEFLRYGVMHRNTFVNAPQVLDSSLYCEALSKKLSLPVYIAGQLGGTEGYVEAIRSGLHVGIQINAFLHNVTPPLLSTETVFGALLDYATSPATIDYQPSHVNFGIIKPLDVPIKNKGKRYEEYSKRGARAILSYRDECESLNLL